MHLPSSFFPAFLFVKGQVPSAALMEIKVLLLCDCPPTRDVLCRVPVTHPGLGEGGYTSAGVCGSATPLGLELPFPRHLQAPEYLTVFWAEAHSPAH